MGKPLPPDFTNVLAIIRDEMDLALSRIHGRLRGEVPADVADHPFTQAAMEAFPGAVVQSATETTETGETVTTYDRAEAGRAGVEVLAGMEGVVIEDPRGSKGTYGTPNQADEVMRWVREGIAAATTCEEISATVDRYRGEMISSLDDAQREILKGEVTDRALDLSKHQQEREMIEGDARLMAARGSEALRGWFKNLPAAHRGFFPKGSAIVAELNTIAGKATA